MQTASTCVRNIAAAALALACALVLAATFAASSAWALDTAKCTARPNADVGSDVLGGLNTRITWEGQSAPDETVQSITLTLPEDTEYGLDNLRVTMLTGDNLMERTPIDAEIATDGQTVTMSFAGQAQPGGYFRVEIYDVFFPSSGGEMQLVGSYVVEGGSEQPIDDIPAINVVATSASEILADRLEQNSFVQKWESVKFLHLFFSPPILVKSFPVVVKGFFMALGIVLVAFPIAIPIGLALALMRMSRFRVLRGIGSVYVNVVRGTPLFLQIYVAFFGLPLAGIVIPNFTLGVIVLSLNSGAYLCEIFRAGIQSIPKGQFEASRSLGMNGAQTMFFVIIPQTVRRVLPTMTSEFILLYKDTSLLAAVGVMEVVMYAKTIVASTGSITPYIVAACFYLLITLPLAKLVGNLEARMAGNDTGRATPTKKRKAKGAPELGASDHQPAGVVRPVVDELDTSITPEQMSSL